MTYCANGFLVEICLTLSMPASLLNEAPDLANYEILITKPVCSPSIGGIS